MILIIVICLFVIGQGIFNFKSDKKNVNFTTQFSLGSISI